MSYALKAMIRNALGRRAKTLLKAGDLPAVVYGRGVEARNIQVNGREFRKILSTAGMSSLIDLDVAGEPVKVLIKDVQVNPVSMIPDHVDFHQINMQEELQTEVPLKIVGESIAVKGLAGTLVQSLDEIKIKCLPADLPHEIEVDISSLKTFDDTITIGSLKIPAGVEVLNDANEIVASVAAPLTEEQLKKMEEGEQHDVSAIKTEAEDKKAADEAAKLAEEGEAKGGAAGKS
ncbi:MAG: 50S ribosomal protein L25 [Patescibacteria group bacterium]